MEGHLHYTGCPFSRTMSPALNLFAYKLTVQVTVQIFRLWLIGYPELGLQKLRIQPAALHGVFCCEQTLRSDLQLVQRDFLFVVKGPLNRPRSDRCRSVASSENEAGCPSAVPIHTRRPTAVAPLSPASRRQRTCPFAVHFCLDCRNLALLFSPLLEHSPEVFFASSRTFSSSSCVMPGMLASASACRLACSVLIASCRAAPSI